MFGYVKPLRGWLRVCELEAYRAAYCGLCHTLGRRYGWPARFFLQYDFVFLALALADAPLGYTRRRCMASPFCRKTCCRGGAAFDLAADSHILLTYWKLRDSARDKKWGFAARLGLLLMKGPYRKAAARQPALEARFCAGLSVLSDCEARRETSLDRPADAFAGLLAAVSDTAEDETRRRVLYELFYHIGRWVYLVDACDDLREDAKTGAYNPVAARFGVTDGRWTETLQSDLRATLRLSRQRAEAALALLPQDHPILQNIIAHGLPWVEACVLRGTYGKREKKKEWLRHYE